MKKRVISMILMVAMCLTMCVPAFAVAPENESGLPSWVSEGETWFPAGGIMVCEDFGTCPKGHTGPSGYTYEGYTMGQASSNYDDLALFLTVFTVGTRNPIAISVGSLSASILNWLDGKEDPDLTYFKYVYTRGNSTFYHIIYAAHKGGGEYLYVTCETYYG